MRDFWDWILMGLGDLEDWIGFWMMGFYGDWDDWILDDGILMDWIWLNSVIMLVKVHQE
ncbi:MAG: hypothetical protein IT270_20610 [Saprospiraceae bacterium]|nr:hypothetical protein [Saprospiraceae bacterium]